MILTRTLPDTLSNTVSNAVNLWPISCTNSHNLFTQVLLGWGQWLQFSASDSLLIFVQDSQQYQQRTEIISFILFVIYSSNCILRFLRIFNVGHVFVVLSLHIIEDVNKDIKVRNQCGKFLHDPDVYQDQVVLQSNNKTSHWECSHPDQCVNSCTDTTTTTTVYRRTIILNNNTFLQHMITIHPHITM